MLKMKRDLVLQCFISVLSYKSILCTFFKFCSFTGAFFIFWDLGNAESDV